MKCSTMALSLAFCLLVASPGKSDEKLAPAGPEEFAKAQQAGIPGPAHDKLNVLAGQWTYTCKLWMEPGKSPIETKGTLERVWILGGRFLSEKITGTGFDGQPGFEGFGLLGYDNNLKKYTQTFACTMGTGTATGTGVARESGGFTFETQCTCPLLQTTVTGRDEIRLVSPDKIVVESYKTLNGQEIKVMEIVAIRQK